MSDAISQILAGPQGCSAPFQASAELVQALQEPASAMIAAPGQTIFTVNAPARGVYLVRSGTVRAFLLTHEGREILNRLLGPGTLLGVPAAMCAKEHQFTAQAVTEVELAFISTTELNEFLRSRPALCMQVVSMMSDELKQLSQTRSHMKTCTHTDCSLHSACQNCTD